MVRDVRRKVTGTGGAAGGVTWLDGNSGWSADDGG